MLSRVATGACALLGLLSLVVLIGLFAPPSSKRPDMPPDMPEVSYSDVLDYAAGKQMHTAFMQGNAIRCVLTDGRNIRAYLPDDPGLAARLAAQGVHVVAMPAEDANGILRFLLSWIPTLVIFGVLTMALCRISRGLAAIEAQVSRLATLAQHQANRGGLPPDA